MKIQGIEVDGFMAASLVALVFCVAVLFVWGTM